MNLFRDVGRAAIFALAPLTVGSGCKSIYNNTHPPLATFTTKGFTDPDRQLPPTIASEPHGENLGIGSSPRRPPTKAEILAIAKEAGMLEPITLTEAEKNSQIEIISFEEYVNRQCGDGNRVNRLGHCKCAIKFSPPKGFRNPNYDPENSPVRIGAPGIPVSGIWGVLDYGTLWTSLTGGDVLVVPNDQPEGIFTGKDQPALPIRTILNGVFNTFETTLDSKSGAKKEPCIGEMARLVLHFSERSIDVDFIAHSQGVVNVEATLDLLLRFQRFVMKRDGCEPFLRVARVDYWAAPVGIHVEHPNVHLYRYRNDWINGFANASVTFGGLAGGVGHRLSPLNGDFLGRRAHPLDGVETVGPRTTDLPSHAMGSYYAAGPCWFIDDIYGTSKHRAQLQERKWSPNDGAQLVALEVFDCMQFGRCSPPLLDCVINEMISANQGTPAERQQSKMFARQFLTLMDDPKKDLKRYALPKDTRLRLSAVLEDVGSGRYK